MRRFPEVAGHGPIGRARQRGFSLLELVIVVILVILLFLVAQDRLLPFRGDAEGTQVASVIGSLRSALGLEVARRIVDEGPPAVAGMAGMNPMELLQDRPNRYIGHHDPAIDGPVPEGTWYFDPADDALAYRVRFPQYLVGEPKAPVDLRWRVRLLYEDRNANDRFDAKEDRLQGVRLESLDDHRWPGLPRASKAPALPAPQANFTGG